MIGKVVGSQEGIHSVGVLSSGLGKDTAERLASWQHRDSSLHIHSSLLVVVGSFFSAENRLLKASGCRIDQEVLKKPNLVRRTQCVLQKPALESIRLYCRRRRQAKWECERIVSAHIRHVFLAHAPKQFFGGTRLHSSVVIEDVTGSESFGERVASLVPPKQIEVVDDLVIGVVHRSRRE